MLTASNPSLPDLDDPEGIFALLPGHPSYVGEDVALRYLGLAQRERLLRAYRAGQAQEGGSE